MSTYTNFTIETDADGIALVTWDMPEKSMNVFTSEVMDELNAIVDATVADSAVEGVVFTSGKSTFSGGADLSMIKSMFSFYNDEKTKNPDQAAAKLFELVGRMTGLFRKIETNGKPWVSAINGTCMGGAFEMSLACHARVASDAPGVKMALPEVKVGLFPGAGGTQRVPRLANQQDALQMMTTGSSLTAQRAKAMGLVTEIAPAKKLVETAKKLIKGGLKPVQPWDEKGFKLPGGAIYSAAGANLWPAATAILRRETSGNYPAALAILKSVYEGLLVPFDTGLKIEQRYFTEILQTTEAGMMIRSLFVSLQELNKGARRPVDEKPTKLKKIGVIGAGFMGAGIAYVTAKAGIPVVLIDRDQESADKGKAHTADLIAKEMQKGRATEADKEKLLSLITATPDYALLEGADLVIEAVFEDMKIKRETFAKLEARCRPDTIFCTNSSVMSPSEISAELKHRERFVGTHFWNPGHLIPLVEVVKSDASSDEVAQTVMEVLRSVGKKPVLCKKDVPGFIANRMQHALWREAISIVENGIADAATVDEAVRYSFGLRLPQLGPMENADMVGTDLTYNIHDYILRDLEDSHEPSPLLKQLRDAGKIGFKTGEGFQKWTPEQVAQSNAELNEYLIRMLYGK